ncbi:rRNA-processing protein EBP2 [Fulvia fulva]|uniref:rRNA-processing protein EBP2 n=1 Tax=Passalora fulva TaxID=5499 RepID=A0A9Q8P904_PASFU|nr:rRNA-processing protein EBP2 [Fulvia fulva]KAK4623948.1 rRNA-processing protein EBP2 [Fulvia fulva]KAK4625462.1 rRNA-processing protein EBP2 [Fulvia fulva]UJO17552.1 rRNA-processing protein EBP2 [Fulvia fulva]WPV15446.1 rRNA-processing protein EBP2 [Fulvia fulva]WPV30249.1 rRNA-processing protein EBP2 [Fulvia fulva]
MPKPAALKLKKTLDRDQGRNYKLEKQKKLQKEAEKRKRQKQRSEIDVDALEHAISDEEVEEEVQSAAERKKESKAAKKAAMAEAVNGEADGWETEESQDAEDEDAEDAEGGAEVEGEMEDESESDSELGDNDVDEDDEDIPLSDIESLASEDRADVIPHQRLTINNTAALQRSLKSFALPSSLPFSANQTVVSTEPVQIADVDDDLNRELAFYRQSLDAVTEARSRLKKEGVPFSRPTDYFAEMVKSEEQMGKVRAKMLDEAARKKASADARRQRDLKKFGKAVQVAKLQERQKEKTKTLDRIQTLKRKRQGADLTANEDDRFDVALEDAATTQSKDRAAKRAKGAADGPNRKRQKKDEKFGFGGKKRFSKSNDAKSTNDDRSYSQKRMKSGGKGGKPRPGKSKRAKM